MGMDAKRINLKQLKQYLALIDKHKLDCLEISGLKVIKTRHFDQKAASQPQDHGISNDDFEPTSLAELDAQIKKEMGGSS